MRPYLLCYLLVACVFVINGCSGCAQNRGATLAKTNPAPQPVPSPSPAPPLPPMTGDYCTIYYNNEVNNLACLQASGQWQAGFGFDTLAINTNNFIRSWRYPSFSKLSNGNIVVSYVVNSPLNDNQVYIFERSPSGTAWVQRGVEASPGALDPQGSPYTQFGGSFFELNNAPYFFWTGHSTAYISTPVGNTWMHYSVDPANANLKRHPEVYKSQTQNQVYLHMGEPSPKVWRFNGVSITQVGNITPATQSTLYTSLTEWNSNPVIAFTQSDFLVSQSWYTATDITKVFAFNGNSWSQLGGNIQETPGHDGVKPFLFTLNNELHIMYADYSTSGVPTVFPEIKFRFRVKKWTGAAWQFVGGESDEILLSQRFEFLLDNGNVFVNVLQPRPGGGTRQVVLRWNNGSFGYLGNPLVEWPTINYLQYPRPSAVIKLNP